MEHLVAKRGPADGHPAGAEADQRKLQQALVNLRQHASDNEGRHRRQADAPSQRRRPGPVPLSVSKPTSRATDERARAAPASSPTMSLTRAARPARVAIADSPRARPRRRPGGIVQHATLARPKPKSAGANSNSNGGWSPPASITPPFNTQARPPRNAATPPRRARRTAQLLSWASLMGMSSTMAASMSTRDGPDVPTAHSRAAFGSVMTAAPRYSRGGSLHRMCSATTRPAYPSPSTAAVPRSGARRPDDDVLDLRGTLPDPLDAQGLAELLGDVLAHVAAAAEHLDRSVGDPAGDLGAEQS